MVCRLCPHFVLSGLCSCSSSNTLEVASAIRGCMCLCLVFEVTLLLSIGFTGTLTVSSALRWVDNIAVPRRAFLVAALEVASAIRGET
jgi:hypothetical protein